MLLTVRCLAVALTLALPSFRLRTGIRAPTSSTHAVSVFLPVLTLKSRMVRLLPPAVKTRPPECVIVPARVRALIRPPWIRKEIPAAVALASETGATVTPLAVRAAAVFLSSVRRVFPPVSTRDVRPALGAPAGGGRWGGGAPPRAGGPAGRGGGPTA